MSCGLEKRLSRRKVWRELHMDGIHNLRFSVSKGISIWTVPPPKGTKRNSISLNQRSSQHWGWSVQIELMLL